LAATTIAAAATDNDTYNIHIDICGYVISQAPPFLLKNPHPLLYYYPSLQVCPYASVPAV